MKTTLSFIIIFLLAAITHGQELHIQRSYTWGNLELTAGSSEQVRLGDSSLFVFRTDVLADLRYSDGQRLLIATGRLEIDPATGDFTASDWPYLRGAQAGRDVRFSAKYPVDRVEFHAGKLKIRAALGTVMPEPPVVQKRRKQLTNMEERK